MMLAQPQLPILNLFAESFPVTTGQPPQAPPSPLPPGSSSQTEPWNATLFPACSHTPTTQKLAPVRGSASITAQIYASQLGNSSIGLSEVQALAAIQKALAFGNYTIPVIAVSNYNSSIEAAEGFLLAKENR
jgi:hypothetical protein